MNIACVLIQPLESLYVLHDHYVKYFDNLIIMIDNYDKVNYDKLLWNLLEKQILLVEWKNRYYRTTTLFYLVINFKKLVSLSAPVKRIISILSANTQGLKNENLFYDCWRHDNIWNFIHSTKETTTTPHQLLKTLQIVYPSNLNIF